MMRIMSQVPSRVSWQTHEAVEPKLTFCLEMTPENAEAEILFLQLVAVFVGAIRCGVLDSDHAKEPLAHCGRFGATYDAIARKLVDVLRDEGIYNRDPETIVAVSTEALQNVSNQFPEILILERDNKLTLIIVVQCFPRYRRYGTESTYDLDQDLSFCIHDPRFPLYCSQTHSPQRRRDVPYRFDSIYIQENRKLR